MSLELTILGYSSALPLPNRFSSAQWLQAAGRFFLIDCGEGTQILLRKYKLSFQKINHIVISHLHADHYLGLPGLLSSMDLYGRTKVLHIHCPRGLDQLIDFNHQISYSKLSFPIIYHFTNPKESEVIFENDLMKIKSFPLKHRIPCTGFVFETKSGKRKLKKDALDKYFLTIEQIKDAKDGLDILLDGKTIPNEELTSPPEPSKKYAYCSDTCYYEKIVPDIMDADLVYHEATFLQEHKERAKTTMHSTAKDAARIALKANVKKLILGHFSIRYKDLELFKSEAQQIFIETYLAEEGKHFKI